ncbi:hypothetical protein QIT93_05660 [Clostridium baratii]|uniref:hypothetical protein n=1 Tax=Clostridium baratii TaxID=1561 RepID=UPI0030CB0D2F
MYTYNFTETSENCSIISKAKKRALIPYFIWKATITNIILFFVLWYMLCYLNNIDNIIYFAIVITYILLQILLFNIYFNKITNKELDEIKEKILNISIEDDGIKFRSDYMLKHIKWNEIKSIKIYDDYFLINYNILGPSNIFIFKCFEVKKDIIISEIEKYKKVGWC